MLGDKKNDIISDALVASIQAKINKDDSIEASWLSAYPKCASSIGNWGCQQCMKGGIPDPTCINNW
jgi:hypothetical protein